MTKVLSRPWRTFILAVSLLAGVAPAQELQRDRNCPRTAADLYSRLRTVGLDEQRVYHVRRASIDRPNLHLDFDDGTLAFTEDICGRITGAVFEGEGEILLRPPNKVERESLALFTGMAILEEQFYWGYLRFNDDTAAALQPFLSAAPDGSEFVKQWGNMGRSLAQSDTLRLLLDFSQFLPASDGSQPGGDFPGFLHAHLLGRKLGGFEVYWDAAATESLSAGQSRLKDGATFFDVWTSFAPNAPGVAGKSEAPMAGDVAATFFRIRAAIEPPPVLKATAAVDVHVRKGGGRTLLFELSRYLKLDAVQENGRPLEFIQNQALEGTQLQRKGNDLVAVVFPAPLRPGQDLKLRFSYAGEVLSEAGKGLLYVGERGTWYPSFGLSPARFDLEFHYPAEWTLVATGKQVPPVSATDPDEAAEVLGRHVSHWVSERPMAVAGFNLGKYIHAEAKSGSIVVEAYGTMGVERSFPQAPPEVIEPLPSFPRRVAPPPIVVTRPPPSPARDAQAVAERAAKAISSFEQWFEPYPYGSLALTQMPGNLSQGWPGLIFLSSYAFLSPQEQADLHLDPITALLSSHVLVHETAHQWWGNLVLWKGYRDQWIMEALAEYSSLLVLEQQNPAQFRQVLEQYRNDLLSKNKDGEWLREAGPVTLGARLVSSHFPAGYETISYERGTWLLHMLRCMLRDSESASHSRNERANPDEPFFRALRKLRERYAGRSVSTQELVQVFEEELPRPLWYEKRRSLDWFLEGWINGTAVPHLEAQDVKITQRERGMMASGRITQRDAPEGLVTAVPVYAVTAGNATVFLGEILADGPETPFRLSAPPGTRKIVLDPGQTILTSLK
ncbi:MAG: M1 family metallopeptidase [Terriglobales bacterium]